MPALELSDSGSLVRLLTEVLWLSVRFAGALADGATAPSTSAHNYPDEGRYTAEGGDLQFPLQSRGSNGPFAPVPIKNPPWRSIATFGLLGRSSSKSTDLTKTVGETGDTLVTAATNLGMAQVVATEGW